MTTTTTIRLDLETSGVLLFAKTSSTASDLSRQFREKTVRKSYLARVTGCLSESDRSDLSPITFPIRSDENRKPLQVRIIIIITRQIFWKNLAIILLSLLYINSFYHCHHDYYRYYWYYLIVYYCRHYYYYYYYYLFFIIFIIIIILGCRYWERKTISDRD